MFKKFCVILLGSWMLMGGQVAAAQPAKDKIRVVLIDARTTISGR